ncbi:hypothetical protein OEZ86_006968 [Tetradesmus obliquus]|nr:hypothetical protein OEZ86_006968 [Tetradesmus obliquus]
MGTTAHHQQQHQQKQQQRGGKVQQGGQKKRGLAGPATPSPSSSLSECCQLDRAHMAPASTKSAKRKAAEALLAASSPTAVEQAQQPHVQVAACAADCSHSLANGWCHTQVRLPHVDWGHVLEAELGGVPSFKLAPGYERIELPGGLQVLVVENAAYIGNALGALRASMQDPVVAIDLEWRPEFGRRFTPVAMVQLASSRVAVLIRTCRMSYKLPAVLKDFLKDPSISLLGFGWAASDEGKMQSTFGVGFKDFGRFLDLQAVAQGLGYCGFGLARLTRAVLGLALPKSKKVSMSNWELAQLSRAQVKYAALDVLVAGQVFRALRLWHSSPSLCEVCHYDLARVSSSSCSAGGGSSASGYMCSCGKGFRDIRGYLQHCERADHKPKWAECGGCGCARRLPWPSGMAKGQAGGGGSSRSSSEEGAE